MLTNDIILETSKATYRTNRAMQGAFIDGATWANEQNAAEINQLRIENQKLETIYAMAKDGTRVQNETIKMLCDIVEKLKPGTIPEKIYENLEKLKAR